MTFGNRTKGGGGGAGTPGRGVSTITRVSAALKRFTLTDATTVDLPEPSFRGPWAATTTYLQGDTVTYLGQTYLALADFTSAASFNAANWALGATKGTDGAVGPAGSNPFIVTGLTGGTPGNYVLRVAGTNTCIDAHPSMISTLRSQPLYQLAPDGTTYYRSGATVPGFTGLTQGQAVALSGKTTKTGQNWTTFDLSTGVPVVLDYTGTQMYVPVGFVGAATAIEFDAPLGMRLSDASAGTTLGDNFDTGYGTTTGAVPALSAKYAQQWSADGVGIVLAGTNPDMVMQENMGTANLNRKMVARTDLTAVADGQIYAEYQLFGASTQANIVSLGARVSGAAGTETGVVFDMNGNTNTIELNVLKAGVVTQIATASISVPAVRYRCVLDFKGTRIQAKFWPTSGSEGPTYGLEGYTDLLTGGLMGIGGRQQFLNIYSLGFSVGSAAAPRV